MFKIGVHLRRLSQNKSRGFAFLDHSDVRQVISSLCTEAADRHAKS